jgi:hypothetical protein
MRRQNNNALDWPMRTLQVAVVIVTAFSAGGCEDYLDRRDTATRGAGESVAFNKATQTIDRWPKASRRDRWNSDGERARLAIDRYRKGTTTPPMPVGSSATAQPSGTAAPAK